MSAPRVGVQSARVYAGFQWSEVNSLYNVACGDGYYGAVGEFCAACGRTNDGMFCEETGKRHPTMARAAGEFCSACGREIQKGHSV